MTPCSLVRAEFSPWQWKIMRLPVNSSDHKKDSCCSQSAWLTVSRCNPSITDNFWFVAIHYHSGLCSLPHHMLFVTICSQWVQNQKVQIHSLLNQSLVWRWMFVCALWVALTANIPLISCLLLCRSQTVDRKPCGWVASVDRKWVQPEECRLWEIRHERSQPVCDGEGAFLGLSTWLCGRHPLGTFRNASER